VKRDPKVEPNGIVMTFDEAHRVIKEGDILSLRCELEKGTSPNLANQFSWTLLMLAAMTGNTSMGELLVSNGADVNSANDFGESALSLAAHFGHIPPLKPVHDSHCQTRLLPRDFKTRWPAVREDALFNELGTTV
jgi:ankyrin repeat protein